MIILVLNISSIFCGLVFILQLNTFASKPLSVLPLDASNLSGKFSNDNLAIFSCLNCHKKLMCQTRCILLAKWFTFFSQNLLRSESVKNSAYLII